MRISRSQLVCESSVAEEFDRHPVPTKKKKAVRGYGILTSASAVHAALY